MAPWSHGAWEQWRIHGEIDGESLGCFNGIPEQRSTSLGWSAPEGSEDGTIYATVLNKVCVGYSLH